MGLVVSYHCGGAYKTEADRLIASLRALGLDYRVTEIADRGGWRANVNVKAEMIMAAMRGNPTTDILYVDADSVIHSDPFVELGGPLAECDIAVHHFRGTECCSGTIWLPWREKRSAMVQSLMRRWMQLNEARSSSPPPQPQSLLAETLGDAPGIDIGELPASHCYIFDLTKQLHPDVTPVIEHLQASRDFRVDDRQVDCPNGPRAARIAELQCQGEGSEVRGEATAC